MQLTKYWTFCTYDSHNYCWCARARWAAMNWCCSSKDSFASSLTKAQKGIVSATILNSPGYTNKALVSCYSGYHFSGHSNVFPCRTARLSLLVRTTILSSYSPAFSLLWVFPDNEGDIQARGLCMCTNIVRANLSSKQQENYEYLINLHRYTS